MEIGERALMIYDKHDVFDQGEVLEVVDDDDTSDPHVPYKFKSLSTGMTYWIASGRFISIGDLCYERPN